VAAGEARRRPIDHRRLLCLDHGSGGRLGDERLQFGDPGASRSMIVPAL
jgi:hypothetical protein